MNAIEYFKQAEAAWDREAYDEAIQKFDQCLCSNPSPPVAMKAYLNLGVMILRKFRFEFRKGEDISDEECRWVIRAGICGQKVVEIYKSQISNTTYEAELHEIFLQAKGINQFGTTYCLTKRNSYGKLDFRDLAAIRRINLPPLYSILDEENKQLQAGQAEEKYENRSKSGNFSKQTSENKWFYIYKNNQKSGPHEESMIIHWLQNGHLSSNDIAIRHGMTEWQTLGTILGLNVKQPATNNYESIHPDLAPNKWEYDIPVESHIRIELEGSGRIYHKYYVGEIALKCIKCSNVVPLSLCSNCDSNTYEPGRSTDRTIGLFCTQCETGFSYWTCSKCKTKNAVNKTVAKRKGCFIATAAFGNYKAPEVIYLSTFRDDWLSKRVLGRIFIDVYYVATPQIARVIAKSDLLRLFIRKFVLRPIIFSLKQFRR